MKNTSSNERQPLSFRRIGPLGYSIAIILLAATAWLIPLPLATKPSNAMSATPNVGGSGSAVFQSPNSTFYFHGTGPADNPPTLFLNGTAPTATTEKFKDSPGINRNGGNPWKDVGAWPTASAMTAGTLASLSDFHVWLGLKNSDDQGTYFDLRVEAYKNSTLVATGQSLCITGVTRNPTSAKEVVVAFGSFSAVPFNGASDVLSLKVLTRVGTTAAGASCGGHNNAVGLRLYFDAVARQSKFTATNSASDNTPPGLTVAQPVDNAITAGTQVNVTGTFSDQSPTTITVNGVAATLQGSNFTALVPVTEGPNSLLIAATDAPGNRTEVTRHVVRDTTPPTVVIQQPAANAIINASQIAVSGTFNDATATTVKVNNVNATLAGNTFTATVPLVEGSNVLNVVAADAAGNQSAPSRNITRDSIAPSMAISQPTDGAFTKNSQITVTGTFTDATATTIKVNNVPATITGAAFSSVVVLNEGPNTLQLVALDAAGNQTEVNRVVTRDSVAPIITPEEPVDGKIGNASQILVKGSYSDASPVTITVNGVGAALDGGNFSLSVPLSEGQNTLDIVASDAAGNQSQTSLRVLLDTTAPLLTVEQPGEGATVTESLLTISGTVSDANRALVTINDDFKSLVKINGNQFTAVTALAEGANTLTIRAFDGAGNVTEIVRSVVYQIDHTPPVLTLLEPADGTAKQTVFISGNVTTINPPVNVSANGHPMALSSDGTFAGGLDLAEGVNQILVQAEDANGNRTTITRSITIDTIAPSITELSPAVGSVIDSTSLSIRGRITDSTPVTVFVNGVAASVGSDAHFTAQNVPINEGEHQFVITATDAAGNASSTTLSLFGKDNTPPSAPDVFATISPTRLIFQTIEGRAEPGSQVTIAGGSEPVTTDAAFGTGLFTSTVNLIAGAHLLTITASDSSGNVSTPAQLTITSDPALALPPAGQPAQINTSSGNAQRGLTGAELPRPLIAIVTDQTGAPVAGVTVHFALIQGGGHLIDGGNSFEVQSDAQGRAGARYVNDAQAGIQLIRANFTGNSSTPATFSAEALTASTPGITFVSGVVEDQNLRALPNVLVRIGGQQTRTGVDGRFIVNSVPSGPHQLLELVGRDQISLPGRWPNISYDFDVLPGIDNSLGRPLFLPQVNEGISLPLDAGNVVTQDTTFELAVASGETPIRVTARAGTHISFPPDVTDKKLSVTRISTNRTPMVLEDGRATNLYISVQPSGAIFETPLEISFPNLDRQPPNSQVLLMSFDHDAGRYVQVGTGHVSADGRSVASDAGSGIRIGAWHALPPPRPQPEVTVLGHIQIKGNSNFEDHAVLEFETWVEGTRAVLTTAPEALATAPQWNFRATFSVAPGTASLARMEASVVTQKLSLSLPELSPPTQSANAATHTSFVQSQATTADDEERTVILAVGQSADQPAVGEPAPQNTTFLGPAYSWKSNDTSIASVDFASGFNSETHPSKATIKGLAPGSTTVTVKYTPKYGKLGVVPIGIGTIVKTIKVTVIDATSLEAELPSTRNVVTGAAPAPGLFPTTKKDLAYEPSDPRDLMVVMQDAGQIKIKAVGLKPNLPADSIRWKLERNPDDTVSSGLPDFAASDDGTQFTIGPNFPGSFRVICFVDTYRDNQVHQDLKQELKVIHLAIVRLTVQSGSHFIEANPEFSGTLVPHAPDNDQYILSTTPSLSSPPHFTMELQADVLVEGGGSTRMVGVDRVVVRDSGNLTADSVTVRYPVPHPAPPAPGDVEGTMQEIPGAHMPLVDSRAAAPSGGDDCTRTNTNVEVLPWSGGGELRRVSSIDGPDFRWRAKHPTTGNTWGSVEGLNAFRETIVGYSGSFNRSYVAVATGDWIIIVDGRNSHGDWVSQGAKILVQGTTNHRVPMTVFQQKRADDAGLQVHGPSALSLLNNPGGLVYLP